MQGPSNHLWPIGTNHKLVQWCFLIIGAIDGLSRVPVVQEDRSNNKDDTLLECFLEGVENYGLPSNQIFQLKCVLSRQNLSMGERC